MRKGRVSFHRILAAAILAGVVFISAASGAAAPSFLTPLPAWNNDTRREADAALVGTFTLQGVTGTVPRHPDGGWDWTWGGPNHDPEFAWFLNRHHQLPALFVAWRETKDARYRQALNDELRDWLRQNPPPAHFSLSSSWRALEVARRVEDSWLPMLFAPQASEAFDPDVLAAMRVSITEHAVALHDNHSTSGNHLITEMGGLAAIALAYPDSPDSPAWLDYALAQVRDELKREIYPDGAETELSNLYQGVVLGELQQLADMLIATGREKDFAALRPTIESAWNYYANTLNPLGHGPLNNDSSVEDDAASVRQMAATYQRPDWLFIATAGREGTAPVGAPSRYFPYAGLAVMRGGWGAQDEWAYFNMGPHGSDHQHANRLDLSLGGGGREFLVDDGRYNYQPGPWRDYFTGPRGHNVVLLDGQGALLPPDVVTEPVQVREEINPTWDFFAATAPFAGDALRGEGPAYHTRAVLYARKNYWIIADQMLCAGAHEMETLWHFHPDCAVQRDGDLIYTADAGHANCGLLAVNFPAGGANIELVRGREDPAPQGWYSPDFNLRLPATCAVVSTPLRAPRTLIWVCWIAPAGRDISATRPQVEITADTAARLTLRLTWPDGAKDTATIPFTPAEPAAWARN
jgi:hypothetical protein